VLFPHLFTGVSTIGAVPGKSVTGSAMQRMLRIVSIPSMSIIYPMIWVHFRRLILA
jgi:hypothetical protein